MATDRLSRRLPAALVVAALLLLGGAAALVTSRAGGDVRESPEDGPAVGVVQERPSPVGDAPHASEAATPTPEIVITPTPEPTQASPIQPTSLATIPVTPSTPFPEAGRAQLARFAPMSLVIPRIGIDAAIVPVGVTDGGQLAAPADYSTVGWFEAGALPGDPGRAVLDGHLDSRTGPAVFYNLDDLAPGDEIVVRMGTGRPDLTFVVRESVVFWTDEAPLDRVFGPSERAELILITCDGPFDGGGGGYLQRRIVFAELHTTN